MTASYLLRPLDTMPADLTKAWREVMAREYDTIHDFAAALIQLVRKRDSDGRDIGFDYTYIRDAILDRFPTVELPGRHCGKPTKMSYKELQKITGELNRARVRLPFRPRRQVTRRRRSNVKAANS